GRLDESVLRESIQVIVNRHDALRTTFSPTGDRQSFAANLQVEINGIDLSSLEPNEQNTRIGQLKATEARLPFDLVHGPVIRFTLIRFGSDRHALLFTAHHIVF